MALSQFRNLSNWERHDVTIKAHELYTLDFINANPNYFVITNPNMARLKIGISTLPRENSFEFKVEYNTTETLGRPHGTQKLYILNDSAIEVKIIVFSATNEFDPEILKNLNVGLEGYIIQTSTEIEGVQEGVELPVKLDSPNTTRLTSIVNAVTETMNNVKNINNTVKDGGSLDNILDGILGSTGATANSTNGLLNMLQNAIMPELSSIKNYNELIKNFIEKLEASYSLTDASIFTEHETTTEKSTIEGTKIKIEYISNDGDEDLIIMYTDRFGDSRLSYLRPGEILNNIFITRSYPTAIKISGVGTNYSIRYSALIQVKS